MIDEVMRYFGVDLGIMGVVDKGDKGIWFWYRVICFWM